MEELARRNGVGFRRARRERASTAELVLAEQRVAVAASSTYMNESGRAVHPLVRRYGISDLTRLVVVHDELDLPVGCLRLKVGGGLAGHRGLKSIEAHLRSRSFTRVRIGIGRPSREAGMKGPVIDHVLGRPGEVERDELLRVTAMAADALECMTSDTLEAVMNRFNASSRRESGGNASSRRESGG